MPEVPAPRANRASGVRTAALHAAPLLLGAAVFRLVTGGRMLLPTNIGWIQGEDPTQHYLGWAFFRQGPWTWPYGASPDWGLEFSNSILYTDSVPLLAFVFKPFSPLLPHPFQYLGIWVLSCFMLQAWFAWKIAGRFTASTALRLSAAGFFVFSPPMVFRLVGHWSLIGHWTILAALYLWLTPDGTRRTLWWSLLTATAALVHMYLFLMTTLLWGVSWVTRVGGRQKPWRALLVEAVAVPSALLFSLWQVGFFLVGEGKAGGGYGRFGMNLNALVNPSGWSYVLPSLPTREGNHEGFSFLGLGGLFLMAVAVPAAVRLRQRGALRFQARWIPLAVLCLLLTPLAVSHHVTVGDQLHVYPIPAIVESVGEMTRASGRLFWPVFYATLVAALALVIRGYRPRTAAVLVGCAFLLQATDTAHGWLNVNPSLRARGRSWNSSLTHEFWYEAPSVYRKIRVILPRNHAQNWREISDHAQRHGMATDAAYLSRVDRGRYLGLFRKTERLLREGGFEADSVYILQGSNARRVPCVVDPRADLLAIVDGMWVLAPGWKHRFGDRFSEPALPPLSLG